MEQKAQAPKVERARQINLSDVSSETLRVLAKFGREKIFIGTAHKIKKIFDILKKRHETYEEYRMGELKKECELDDKGNLVLDAQGNAIFKSEEEKKRIVAYIEKTRDQLFYIPILKLSELGRIEVTAADLDVLENILVDDLHQHLDE